MNAVKGEKYDVTLHWPQEPRRIAAILRSGRCPSHSYLRGVRIPGGRVAVVTGDGAVQLLFRVERIDAGQRVRVADGAVYSDGFVIVAKKGSMRCPGRRDPKYLPVNRNHVGAIAYFDRETGERVFFEPPTATTRASPSPPATQRPFPSRVHTFFSNNIGKTLQQPERELVRDYVEWVGDAEQFEHHFLRTERLYTDLFIRRSWALVEAKENSGGRTLREAIGQLFDYQRHYTRKPRLVVLLPQRPQATMLDLFARKRIAVIWRSGKGRFVDSVDGALTSALRAIARTRRAE
jgi:hypothetical protein